MFKATAVKLYMISPNFIPSVSSIKLLVRVAFEESISTVKLGDRLKLPGNSVYFLISSEGKIISPWLLVSLLVSIETGT